MNVIETRLAGHQANLKSITRFINRQLGAVQITRVELRFSTQSAEPFVPQVAKVTIGSLLREHGMGTADISVRQHEGRIDNATGEHVLRLHHAERVIPTARSNGLMAWLARVFPRWFQAPPAQNRAGTPAVAQSQPPKNVPALSNVQATDYLRTAVIHAASYVETDTNTAIDGGGSRAQQVGAAQIIVRLDYLHAVLGPMVQDDLLQAAKSVGDMVRVRNLSTSPDFKVSYLYAPRAEVEGTSYANETDLEVRLSMLPGLPQRVEPTLDESSVRKNSNIVQTNHDQTFMPGRAPALTVRVLGTLHKGVLQPFAKAFDMDFARLPARFDRDTLAQSGFGRAHPDLLSVASNRCPLVIERGVDGAVQLQTSIRTAVDGISLVMYRHLDTLAALTGTECLSETGCQLVVNDPAGVLDAANGRTFPALVIELLTHN